MNGFTEIERGSLPMFVVRDSKEVGQQVECVPMWS